MKKIIFALLIGLFTSCISAQHTAEPLPVIKGDFIVTDVYEEDATLMNRFKHFYKVDAADFEAGREYYVELIVTDCRDCFHKKATVKFKTTSARQNSLDRAKKDKTK